MSDRPAGPLKLPSLIPPTREAARAVVNLKGHSTSDVWLPEGLWDELDAVRAKHLKIRDQVAAELDALAELDARFHAEDKQHNRDLQQAQRDGNPASVEDCRTPEEQRQAERTAIEERLWAGVVVLAEVADSVPELARECEDDWLADLRRRRVPAQEKRAELERQLAEARAEEFHVHKLGLWLQDLSDDGAFGRQPHPTPEPPPAQFSEELLARSLERPWYRRPDAEVLPVAWQDQQQPKADDVDDLGEQDQTGIVSDLVEREEVTA